MKKIIFAVIFSAFLFVSSVSVSAAEIACIEFDSATWSLLTDSQKDIYFKAAIQQNDGLFPEISVDFNIGDSLKYQMYNDLLNGGESSKISLELLGIADFKLGHFDEVKNTEINHKREEMLNNNRFCIMGANGNYARLEVTGSSTKYGNPCHYWGWQIYNSEGTLIDSLSAADSPIKYDRNIPASVKYDANTCVVTWNSWTNYDEKLNRSANLSKYLGLGGDGLVEFAPDDDSGDILPPDYSDQTLANSDIINYLEKIYGVELDSLSAERDIQNALLMINSTLNGLDNNSDNSEILGALNAIKALLENNLGGGSDSSTDYTKQLDSILEKLDTNNEYLKQLTSAEITDSEQEHVQWLSLFNTFKSKVGYSAIEKNIDNISSTFFSKKEFYTDDNGDISVASISSDGSVTDISSFDIPSLSFNILGAQCNLFSMFKHFNANGGIDAFKTIVGAFLVFGFVLALFRSVPSIISQCSQLVGIGQKGE